MPSRILREGILTSERVCSLSWPEEVFYRRLHSVVDDHGRYFARPDLLRAACYPLQLGKVSDADVVKWLEAIQAAALVSVYQIAGKAYLEVLDFRQELRKKLAKFPGPPETKRIEEKRREEKDDALDASPPGGETAAPKKNGRKRPSVSLPEGFAISPRVRAWAVEHRYEKLEAHFEHFVGYARASGKQYADWDQALMNAIRDDWAKVRVNGSGADVGKLVRELEEEERLRATH